MAKYLVVLCLFVASAVGLVPRINPNGSWRVVGGTPSEDGARPYQISLRSGNSHNCGGTIVHNEYVITAAHCVAGSNAASLTVVAGSNKLNQPGDLYKVLAIFYHENYDVWNIQNDVAILKVEPIVFGDNVGAIAVETEDVAGDVPCILSGWGTTSYPGSLPNDLQEINLLTTTVEFCRSKHSSPPVIESEICTLTKSGEGACHGDSGGPLVRSVDGASKLIGVVSWGSPCARGLPDVFSRASSFVQWWNSKCDNCINA